MRAALARVSAARAALSASVAWVAPALGGRSLRNGSGKVSLWAPERSRVLAANAAALTSYRRAQSAARQVPRDCAGVAAAKVDLGRQVREAKAAYAAILRLAAQAEADLAAAARARQAVRAALDNLARVKQRNPQTTVNTVFERAIPERYSTADYQTLTEGIARSRHRAAVPLGYAYRLAHDVQFVGRRC